MTMLGSIMARLLPPCSHKQPDATERLTAVSAAILEASDAASRSAEGIVRSAKADQAVADDLVHQVRGRLASLDVRRTQRTTDPRLAVITETIRILEGRS